ncbi:MAG: hypothetical protein LBG12_02525 [Synergistaceae bacterium]|jgi:hypothetical protein|nr:hypothetical protein [Synergistaceae bacterium]
MKKIRDLNEKVLTWSLENNMIDNDELDDEMNKGEVDIIEGAYEHFNGLEHGGLIYLGESVRYE